MTFLESMQNRYTTKAYDPDGQIDEKTLNDLKEIVRLSPSSINSQPWKFIFVTDKEVKDKLAEASIHNVDRVKNASAVVVFTAPATPADYEKEMKKYLSDGAVRYYDNNKKPKGDEAVMTWIGKQVYLSLGVLLAACANMGVDSTPMEGIEFSKYDEILGLTDFSTQVAVCIGVRDPEDANQPSNNPKTRRPIDDVVTHV